MSRHTVTEQEFDRWLGMGVWQQYAASFGGLSAKRLEADRKGSYRVTDHSAVIYEGPDKYAAIAAYNEAR